jgi:hypothetical protein
MESTRSDAMPPGMAERLGSLRVAVIGAGRIGSGLLRSLESIGVRRIEIYEADARVAESWRGRQVVHAGDFWDELTLARLVDYDFAICTVDRRQARERANQKCLIANVNLIQAWTEGPLALVGVHPFGVLDDCACHDCMLAGNSAPLPLASLKLSMCDGLDPPGANEGFDARNVAGALAAAVLVRVVAGTYGMVARRVVLDMTRGQGSAVELRRDPHCPRCHALQRPVPIVHTRNRWTVSPAVARDSPSALEQPVELSNAIAGLEGHSFRVRDLADRFHGGPVPAKFALTMLGGRVVCLDFEDLRGDEVTRATAGPAKPGGKD